MWRVAVLGLLCMGASGCRHRQNVAVIPLPAQAPVPLDKVPEPKTPPLVATVPLQPAPLPSVAVPKKPKKQRRKPVPATPVNPAPSPAATEVASAGAAPEPGAVIGALTAGGDAAPEKKQLAGEMLAALDKRLANVPAPVATRQRDGIERVKNFERDARKALDSGDAEGAVTLVTKAKLLLDDLEK